MKRTTTHGFLTLGLLTLALAGTPAALFAHEGEVHDEAAEAAVPQAVLPRIAVATDELELVAVLEPGRLLVWADRFASNEPVRGARLEVEIDGRSTLAEEDSEGRYVLPLAQPLPPGQHLLTFTLQAGELADLLTATLDVPAAAAPAAARSAWPGSWPQRAGAAGATTAAVALLAWGLRRRKTAAV